MRANQSFSNLGCSEHPITLTMDGNGWSPRPIHAGGRHRRRGHGAGKTKPTTKQKKLGTRTHVTGAHAFV